MLAKQAARPHASGDLPGRHSSIEELHARDNPMPGAGDSRQFLFDRPAWSTHTVP
jgi:hypothetical protein